MILQLSPSIPLQTPKGAALAILVIDLGEEHHLQWVCLQDDTGECWTWPNPQVRAQKNITMGRTLKNKEDRVKKHKFNWKRFVDTWPKKEDFPIYKADTEYNRMFVIVRDTDVCLPAKDYCKKQLLWASACIEVPEMPKKIDIKKGSE